MGFVEKVERQEWEDSLTDEWQVPTLAHLLCFFVLEVFHKNKDAQEEINISITLEEGDGRGQCLSWNHHGTEVLEGHSPGTGRGEAGVFSLSQAALRNPGLFS